MSFADTIRSCILIEFRKNHLKTTPRESIFSWLRLCICCNDEDLLIGYTSFSINRLTSLSSCNGISKTDYQSVLLSAMKVIASSPLLSLSCKKKALLLLLSATQLVLVGTDLVSPDYYSPLENIAIDELGTPEDILSLILGVGSPERISALHSS